MKLSLFLFLSLSLFLTHSGEGFFGTKVRNFEKERSREWIVKIRLFERTCSQHYSGQRNAGGGAHRHMQATQLLCRPPSWVDSLLSTVVSAEDRGSRRVFIVVL